MSRSRNADRILTLRGSSLTAWQIELVGRAMIWLFAHLTLADVALNAAYLPSRMLVW